jgi:hypothetical protein
MRDSVTVHSVRQTIRPPLCHPPKEDPSPFERDSRKARMTKGEFTPLENKFLTLNSIPRLEPEPRRLSLPTHLREKKLCIVRSVTIGRYINSKNQIILCSEIYATMKNISKKR